MVKYYRFHHSAALTLFLKEWGWYAVLGVAFGIASLWVLLMMIPSGLEPSADYFIVLIYGPASWVSMFIYWLLLLLLTTKERINTCLSGMGLSGLASVGMLMAFLSFWTGLMWVTPRWGSWQDARLACELVFFLLYICFIVVQFAIGDSHRANRAGSAILLVGGLSIFIFYFARRW